MSKTEDAVGLGTAKPTAAKMLIGGRWVDADDGKVVDVENPANREIIGTIPRGGAQDVAAAVEAATAAFPKWSQMAPRDRGVLLRRIANSLGERVEEMARSIARETGNALRTQARPEAQMAVDIFYYFAGLAAETKGETIPLGEHVLSYTRREPYGVVGAIIPWNGPIGLAALKIAPAIAAGNTMVLKAAEDASLCVLALASACQEILPPGVLNVITGIGEECGAALANNPGIHKLSFTGSTDVGRSIMAAASERIVPVSLELGGKNPCVVFPDANNEATVDGVMAAMRFTRQSQSCTAGSRLFVHASIFDSFLKLLSDKVTTLKIGDPLNEETDVGSLINAKQFQRVCGYIDEGLGRPEARLLVGGLPPKSGPLSQGYFTLPTIFANGSNDWRMAREEIFGPVLIAIPWEDENDVVQMANDTHFGLAGYVWTHNLAVALRTAHAIRAGWVQVNQATGQSLGQPYGGFKQSGIGKEFSLDGMLNSFTHVKAVTVNLRSS